MAVCLCGQVHTGKDPMRPLFTQDCDRFMMHMLPLVGDNPRLPSWSDLLQMMEARVGSKLPPRLSKGKARPPVYPDRKGWLLADVMRVIQGSSPRLSRKKCVESIRRCIDFIEASNNFTRWPTPEQVAAVTKAYRKGRRAKSTNTKSSPALGPSVPPGSPPLFPSRGQAASNAVAAATPTFGQPYQPPTTRSLRGRADVPRAMGYVAAPVYMAQPPPAPDTPPSHGFMPPPPVPAPAPAAVVLPAAHGMAGGHPDLHPQYSIDSDLFLPQDGMFSLPSEYDASFGDIAPLANAYSGAAAPPTSAGLAVPPAAPHAPAAAPFPWPQASAPPPPPHVAVAPPVFPVSTSTAGQSFLAPPGSSRSPFAVPDPPGNRPGAGADISGGFHFDGIAPSPPAPAPAPTVKPEPASSHPVVASSFAVPVLAYSAVPAADSPAVGTKRPITGSKRRCTPGRVPGATSYDSIDSGRGVKPGDIAASRKFTEYLSKELRLPHHVARIVHKMLHKYFNIKTQENFVMNPPPPNKLFVLLNKLATKQNAGIADPSKRLPAFDTAAGSQPFTLYTELHARLNDLSFHLDSLPSAFSTRLTVSGMGDDDMNA